jgi:hypothetical protein
MRHKNGSYMGTGMVQFRDSRDLTGCMADMKIETRGATMYVTGSRTEFQIEALRDTYDREREAGISTGRAPRISLYNTYDIMFSKEGDFEKVSPTPKPK